MRIRNQEPVLWHLLAAVVAAMFFAGCSTVPVTGRTQINVIPRGEEMKLGYNEFSKMKQEVPISKDPQLNALVQKVGKRIAAVVGSEMPDAQWEFVVFESKEANAFCLPGGKVGIYTGILPVTRDEAGLATVMGHEVAHAVARHGGERMTTALGLQAAGALGSAMTKPETQATFQQLYGLGSQVLVALPHSRSQEAEADHIGLIYMARAGYPPEASVDFWQRFAAFNKQQGAATPWFLRTHPLDEQRIANLQKWMPEARAQFKP